MKMVHNNYTLNLPPETQEYYIRDAAGNLMTTYKCANAPSGTNYNMKLTANDQPIYGSDRIGSHISGFLKNNTNTSTVYSGSYGYYVLLPTISLPAANSLKSDRLVSYRMMDYKRYEIKDHLVLFSCRDESRINNSFYIKIDSLCRHDSTEYSDFYI